MRKEILLVRHGQTTYNEKKIIQGSGVNGPLNKTGFLQADALYEYYKDHNFELGIASGLLRSQQTLEKFNNNGLPIEFTPLINEISWGIHEGRPSSPELHANYKTLVTEWASGNLDARMENGESAMEVKIRIESFLTNLILKPANKIIVCSHGRTIRAFVSLIKHGNLFHMESVDHHNTASFNIEYSNDRFLLLSENNTIHLEKYFDNGQ